MPCQRISPFWLRGLEACSSLHVERQQFADRAWSFLLVWNHINLILSPSDSLAGGSGSSDLHSRFCPCSLRAKCGLVRSRKFLASDAGGPARAREVKRAAKLRGSPVNLTQRLEQRQDWGFWDRNRTCINAPGLYVSASQLPNSSRQSHETSSESRIGTGVTQDPLVLKLIKTEAHKF